MVMCLRPWTLSLPLVACLWSMTQSASGLEEQPVRQAVKLGDSVVCLYEGGKFGVWETKGGRFDPDLSDALSKRKVSHLASDGKRMWAVEGSRLFAWSLRPKAWEQVAEFDAGGEEIAGVAIVGGTPLLVPPTRVLSPTDRRTFGVPPLKGQLDLKRLHVLALQPTDRVLWIGTGQGEWGGHLVGLDLRTGKWVQFYDSLHYVTGITLGPEDEPIVSWSMSHFDADTLIRVHKPDATPGISHPELEGKYYQRIAYSPFDETLYGVENRSLVSISGGKPETLAELDAPVFERAPLAIGVAPGVIALIPVAPRTLVVVPTRPGPFLLRGRTLEPLRRP